MCRLMLCPDTNKQPSPARKKEKLKKKKNHAILPASCKQMCPKVYFHSACHQHLWKNISCFKTHHSRWLVNMLVFNLLVYTQVRTLRRENVGGGEKVNPREGLRLSGPPSLLCLAHSHPTAPRLGRAGMWLV